MFRIVIEYRRVVQSLLHFRAMPGYLRSATTVSLTAAVAVERIAA